MRLKDKIVKIFDIQFVSIKFWVDSQIELKYIQNTNRNLLTFVINRLNEIRLNSNGVDLNFIPANQNPEDLCTRYMPFNILKDSKIWFYGPEQSNQFIKPEQSKLNIDDRGVEYNSLINMIQNLTENFQKITFRWERYSSYTKLSHYIAWVIKIVKNWVYIKRK